MLLHQWRPHHDFRSPFEHVELATTSRHRSLWNMVAASKRRIAQDHAPCQCVRGETQCVHTINVCGRQGGTGGSAKNVRESELHKLVGRCGKTTAARNMDRQPNCAENRGDAVRKTAHSRQTAKQNDRVRVDVPVVAVVMSPRNCDHSSIICGTE